MVSVTSTLHFRDALHFTITTTTTTTMTTPTTKPPPPPPPPRAQTRPPPLQEQTGLETQLRLESQVDFFFLFFFCITNIYLQCVWYASHDDNNRQHAGPQRQKGAQTMRLASFGPLLQASTITRAQRRLTQVHEGPQQPTQVDEGPQQPTTANEGQRRPTKTKRGPNDASGIVWALGTFFIFISSCFNIY